MKTHTLNILLEVLTPVHVGCGEVYDPTSFMLSKDELAIRVFNPTHLIANLSADSRNSLRVICSEGSLESIGRLYEFMSSQEPMGRKVPVSSAFIHHFQDTLAKLKSGSKDLNKFEIERTAYLPLSGRAYIPGSSLKGSIRTAFLNHLAKIKNRIPIPKKGKELEGKLLDLGRDIVGLDPFRLFSVSDFMPIGDVSTRVVYAVNKKKKVSKFEPRGFSHLMEVIETGAKFLGSISLNPNLNGLIKEVLDLNVIMDSVKDFYHAEHDREERELRLVNLMNDPIEHNAERMLLRIGRHSGAEAVTVNDYRAIKIMGARGKDSTNASSATTLWLASDSKKIESRDESRGSFGWSSMSILTDTDLDRYIDLEKQWQASEELIKREEELRIAQKEELRLLALAKAKAEEEYLANNPWIVKEKEINLISQFGNLKNIISDPTVGGWIRDFQEFARIVDDAIARCFNSNPDKWSEERDREVSSWFEGSSFTYQSRFKNKSIVLTDEENKQVEMIKGLKDWGMFLNKKDIIEIDRLELVALRALKELFVKWGVLPNSSKDDKKQMARKLDLLIRSKAG